MSRFDITTHTIDAAHIREFARATTNGFTNVPRLKLVVNQYVPRKYTPAPGDLSIIFCHANAFHKELYEPLFDDLLTHLELVGVRLRGIWAPDAAHQGASSILNESVLGDQPCWNDLPRDLLHLVNIFAADLPPPLVGMGHSFGGHAVLRASLMHPALFSALVEIDPVIEEHQVFTGSQPARASARRVDIWPTRSEAEDYFRSRSFYKAWDPRALELHIKHGLRDLPTVTYPDKKGVTLATTKHQEVYTFLRCVGPAGEEYIADHIQVADTWRKLKEVVPPVLYIVGGDSPVSSPLSNKRKMDNTPVAEMVTIGGTGHLMPLEKPTETAIVAAAYLKRQVTKWKKDAETDEGTPRCLHLSRSFLKNMSKL